MLDNRVSGIPLVNEQGQVVNVLVKHDVTRSFYETPINKHVSYPLRTFYIFSNSRKSC